MNIDGQRHDGAADVEIVGESQDSHEQVSKLKSHVVKKLHRLILRSLLKLNRAQIVIQLSRRALTSRSPGHRSE